MDKVISSTGEAKKATITGEWPVFTATDEKGKTWKVNAHNATVIVAHDGTKIIQL